MLCARWANCKCGPPWIYFLLLNTRHKNVRSRELIILVMAVIDVHPIAHKISDCCRNHIFSDILRKDLRPVYTVGIYPNEGSTFIRAYYRRCYHHKFHTVSSFIIHPLRRCSMLLLLLLLSNFEYDAFLSAAFFFAISLSLSVCVSFSLSIEYHWYIKMIEGIRKAIIELRRFQAITMVSLIRTAFGLWCIVFCSSCRVAIEYNSFCSSLKHIIFTIDLS